MNGCNLLALGPGEGWHADRLRSAAERLGHRLVYAPYESLAASLDGTGRHRGRCAAGDLAAFDAVLCRTMPAGTLEQITFRLAVLHSMDAAGVPIINPPRTLERAIDKYATLVQIASLGYRVPETIVVQSRKEAMEAFDALGGDVVVKPIFGGEGRGVMRIRDRQLAWYAFSTLDGLGAALYVQKFVPPGGRDTRMLVIGDEVFGIRRTNDRDFRTNVAGGAMGRAIALTPEQLVLARSVAKAMSLVIGAIDLIDCDTHGSVVVEVNGVPGWKGAQGCFEIDLAERMIRCAAAAAASSAAHTS